MQTCGYGGELGHGTYEHEYAVVDRETTITVALFIARRPRQQHAQTWANERQRVHLRARKFCHDLNELELAVPAADAVAAGAGEAGERLELDDLAGVWGSDHLAVADVHHDVAGPA